ncbi:MAG: AsnC family transcriptional regulator [Alphaproteobacteria bacterium]|nr:MAG: AsnC family transcriptional regulator [Alphaproteobacteria bacterium]
MNNSELDRIDWKILQELRKDGRISNVDLASRVGLSQSPCWTRVKSLEERGIIVGYQAIVSQKALGRPETMIVQVTMDRHNDSTMRDFENQVKDIPEVVEACVVAGEFDFLLKVSLEDTSNFEQFLSEKLYKIPSVKQVRSILMIRDLLKAS